MDVSISKKHPNRLNFSATLCYIDQPSDLPPCGTDGRKLVITKAAAEKNVDSMSLMGIDVSDDFCGHEKRQKVGVIERAYIEGNELKGQGFIYVQDFPEIAYLMKNATEDLGFSIEAEVHEAIVKDDGNAHVNDLTFTGVCMLWAKSAAFQKTHIDYIAASKDKGKETDKCMNEDQMKELLKSVTETVQASIDGAVEKLNADLTKTNEAVQSLVTKVEANAQVIEDLKAAEKKDEGKERDEKDQGKKKDENEKPEAKVEASADSFAPPKPKTWQTTIFASHDKEGQKEHDQEFEQIMASSARTTEEKLSAATSRYLRRKMKSEHTV